MSTTDDVTEDAIRLARSWLSATAEGQTAKERRTTGRLAALVADPAGLELAVRFVDRRRPPAGRPGRRARARRPHVGRRARASSARSTGRCSASARSSRPCSPTSWCPPPGCGCAASSATSSPTTAPAWPRTWPRTRAEGFRLNLNLLGEAVLGEREAAARLARVTALVERPDVDYVSVKVSAVASQLSTWDTDGSVDRVVERLRPLYLTAARHGTFLNLDMEEYRDLALTVAVFERLVSDPRAPAAPRRASCCRPTCPTPPTPSTSSPRIAAGAPRGRRRPPQGAPGQGRQPRDGAGRGRAARLAAGAVRLQGRRRRQLPAAASTAPSTRRGRPPLRVGVASHNLFHVAAAHLLAQRRGRQRGARRRDAPGHGARAGARGARRGRRGAALHAGRRAARLRRRDLLPGAAAGGELREPELPARAVRATGAAMDAQEAGVPRRASATGDVPSTAARARRPAVRRRARDGAFANTPDTDPAVAVARAWARGPRRPGRAGARRRGHGRPRPPRSTRSSRGPPRRGPRGPRRRPRTAPGCCAPSRSRLEDARADLVATMVHEAGKTVAEADPEVSEAVDFAALLRRPRRGPRRRRRARRRAPARRAHRGHAAVELPRRDPGRLGARLARRGQPGAGQARAARRRAAGRSRWRAIQRGARRAPARPAASSRSCSSPEGDVGRRLVTHPDVARVAPHRAPSRPRELFAGWRPDLDVLAETSGKNALVITPSADVDLAVADLVRSAFGHAGQKCSAASLAILVGSAGRSDRLRRQLADAVASLRVGPATDLGTAVGPLTEPAQRQAPARPDHARPGGVVAGRARGGSTTRAGCGPPA